MPPNDPRPWPNGARCAVAFTFDMDADGILHLVTTRARTPKLPNSALRYGPEVALPRLLEIYREPIYVRPLSASLVHGEISGCRRKILTDGHEIGHHHYLHEHANTMTAEEEHYWFVHSKVITQMTGKPPAVSGGHVPFFRNTLDILIDEGIHYDASLFGDDVPYVISNTRGRVYEIPLIMASMTGRTTSSVGILIR